MDGTLSQKVKTYGIKYVGYGNTDIVGNPRFSTVLHLELKQKKQNPAFPITGQDDTEEN